MGLAASTHPTKSPARNRNSLKRMRGFVQRSFWATSASNRRAKKWPKNRVAEITPAGMIECWLGTDHREPVFRGRFACVPASSLPTTTSASRSSTPSARVWKDRRTWTAKSSSATTPRPTAPSPHCRGSFLVFVSPDTNSDRAFSHSAARGPGSAGRYAVVLRRPLQSRGGGHRPARGRRGADQGRAVITPKISALDVARWKNASHQSGHGYRLDLDRFDSGWVPLGQLRRVEEGGERSTSRRPPSAARWPWPGGCTRSFGGLTRTCASGAWKTSISASSAG